MSQGVRGRLVSSQDVHRFNDAGTVRGSHKEEETCGRRMANLRRRRIGGDSRALTGGDDERAKLRNCQAIHDAADYGVVNCSFTLPTTGPASSARVRSIDVSSK